MENNICLSVIICTHNPNANFLQRTLDGLRAQSLPRQEWELVVIDNSSKESVADQFDISWHQQGRHVKEPNLGLIHARLRGIAEARGKLLVFVDDDNILASNYLEAAQSIAIEHQHLGVWGGQCIPDYIDQKPESWCMPYLPWLAIHEFDRDYWTNDPRNEGRFIPCGAGLVVRKAVAARFADVVAKSAGLRSELGRRGDNLSGCEDIDLALTACDAGFGIGRFHRLRLTHIIPGTRLSEEYMLKFIEATSCSNRILREIRGLTAPAERIGIVVTIKRWIIWVLGGERAKRLRLVLARERGDLWGRKRIAAQATLTGRMNH